MSVVRRTAAIVVPLTLVVGGVWYGIAHHSSSSSKDDTAGLCTTKVKGLSVVLTATQARNASLISAIAVHRGMPAHAATIALAAALQESKLYNLRGGDRDSLGLFQQRPSQGWGTPSEILDPVHATNAFYDALARVPGYESMPVTVAAQRVQRSGYPSAYAVYEPDARALASALTGFSPAAFACHLTPSSRTPAPAARRAAALRRTLAPAFGTVQVSVAEGSRLEIAAASGPQGWSIASYLVGRAPRLGLSHVGYDGRDWAVGSNGGWRSGGAATAGSVVVG
jgi:hypothetical protein